MSVTVVYRSAADLNRAEYWYEEGPKLQIEVEKLRKVADAARAYLNGGYNETLDGLVLAVLELDKDGER